MQASARNSETRSATMTALNLRFSVFRKSAWLFCGALGLLSVIAIVFAYVVEHDNAVLRAERLVHHAVNLLSEGSVQTERLPVLEDAARQQRAKVVVNDLDLVYFVCDKRDAKPKFQMGAQPDEQQFPGISAFDPNLMFVWQKSVTANATVVMMARQIPLGQGLSEIEGIYVPLLHTMSFVSLYVTGIFFIAVPLIFLAVYYIIWRKIGKPLAAMVHEVKAMRDRKDRSLVPVSDSSNSEIGELVKAFNELVYSLHESLYKIEQQRAQIISYTQTLEERVRDRTQELEESRIKAEVANVQKSRFLVNMNHELRTPINTITGITDLLHFGAFEKNDEFAAALQVIITNALPDPDQTAMVYFLQQLSQALTEETTEKKALARVLASYDQAASLMNIAGQEEKSINGAYASIRDAGQSLISIINEVINLSRVESGAVELSREQIRFTDVFDSCIRQAETYLKAKYKQSQIALGWSVDEAIPEYVFVDGRKVKQILLNLLTNAIKYTEQGFIHITARLEGLESNNVTIPRHNKLLACLHFEVKDTGIGIAEDDQAVLFMEFSRAFAVREIEGTGLGLALCRKLVEKMGGKVGFESQFGTGSTFWFTVPLPMPLSHRPQAIN